MSYTQLIEFNPANGGTAANWCLNNVSRGYSINTSAYDSAWTAWTHSVQHADRNIPSGVAVPIFYSYTVDLGDGPQNYGHINVQLPDGRCWSDGNYYTSVAAYEATHAPKFVGWAESIGTIRIIEENSDMITAGDLYPIRVVMSEIEGWNGQEVHSGADDEKILSSWIGHSWQEFIMHGWSVQNVHRQDLIDKLAAGSDKMDTNDGTEVYRTAFHREPESEVAASQWNNQKFSDIANTSVRASAEWKGIHNKVITYDDVNEQLTAANKQVKELTAQLATQSDDTKNLNAFGSALKWFIVRLGLK